MAMSYCTQDAKRYRKDFANYVCEEVEQQGWSLQPCAEQHFYVDTWFYFPRLDLDPNNYFKVMLDAITDTQKIWIDDNVVCERVQGILYDSENPRIEIVIHPVEYVGIFKDRAELSEFCTRCSTCSRSNRNCSILRKAKLGYVQKDISGNVCLKYRNKGE